MSAPTKSVTAAGLVLCSCVCVWACNVPVFRYALDHWRPDAYLAVLVQHGDLSDEQQAALTGLTQAIEQRGLNISLQKLDLRSIEPASDQNSDPASVPAEVANLREQKKTQLLLYYPKHLGVRSPVMMLDLDESRLAELVDSPVRRELMQRLASGQSLVWLFVASGNESADATARMTLESELRTLTSKLELPKLTDDPEDAIKGGPPLRIEFSILELAINDQREWALREVLLGSEPDLRALNEPMAFPVFGCGRALWPLVGAGISAENVRESAVFATGACSCQVKEQNPGFDLLLSGKWEELLPWTKPGLEKEAQPSVAAVVPIAAGSLPTAVTSAPANELDSRPPSLEEVRSGARFGTGSVIGLVVIAAGALITLAALLMPRK